MPLDFPFNSGKQPDRGLFACQIFEANNVLPTLDGFAPWPDLYTPSTAGALPSAPRGVFSLVLNSGAWVAYIFTATALYQLNADFTLTLIASGYACPTGYDWSAVHFGTKLLFTNSVDGLHSYDVEAGGAVSYISAAGDPAYIFTCANFLVALNCKDANGNRDIRLIKTSGFNDQTNWTTDGADYQELSDGEQIYCGFDLSNNAALIVQASALVLLQFGNAAGGAQFSLRKISNGKGAVGAKACTSFDNTVYMQATDDFYTYDLTNGLVPIGADQIARTYLQEVDQSQFSLVQGAIDPLHKVLLYRYKRNIDNSATVSEVCLGYEYHLKRFFRVTKQTSYLSRLATVAVTYDSATGTYDSQTLTYDDLFFQGSAPIFGALNANYQFSLWTNTSLQGQITTRLDHSATTRKINWATPICDALNPQLEIGVTDQYGVAPVFAAAVTINDDGRFPFDTGNRGRNVQFRLTIPSGDMGQSGFGWTFADGLTDFVAPSGGPK